MHIVTLTLLLFVSRSALSLGYCTLLLLSRYAHAYATVIPVLWYRMPCICPYGCWEMIIFVGCGNSTGRRGRTISTRQERDNFALKFLRGKLKENFTPSISSEWTLAIRYDCLKLSKYLRQTPIIKPSHLDKSWPCVLGKIQNVFLGAHIEVATARLRVSILAHGSFLFREVHRSL